MLMGVKINDLYCVLIYGGVFIKVNGDTVIEGTVVMARIVLDS